jgi:hypothetical protein
MEFEKLIGGKFKTSTLPYMLALKGFGQLLGRAFFLYFFCLQIKFPIKFPQLFAMFQILF